MQHLVVLLSVLALLSAQLIDIDWSNVRPIVQFDRYRAHMPAELQLLPGSTISRQVATAGQFPYQAAIVSNFNDGDGLCGGSILSSKYILTAAHCVQDALGGVAIMGAQNLENVEPSQQRIAYSSVGINVHPGFNPTSTHNDIATIRLVSDMSFNARVVQSQLPAATDTREYVYKIGTSSGFGKTNSTSTSNELMYFQRPIITEQECVLYWGNLVDSGNMCLSGIGGPSTCDDDSGGPLTIQDGDNTLQVGIVSFGNPGMCSLGVPPVYTRVSFFRPWIVDNSDLV
ncbi:brachyurin-like [Armigeres subalbatus]|uniref:brachyurin-like n=1 Tax=Armigeres subalbatus TaxID=124917 RepID=UPI002ED5115A